ncbi:unnamed protein product [Echinostoma caproni]|uniref:SAM domain-containing protein n=1 Tax=Echinostoma caproni TaxID=27848 RepID=A0A183A5H3_9TREM|nr:unnamed protein product [Echinostoma caproni]
MLNGSVSPYVYCKDLQTLVTVTLENVILPLRDELKHCDQNSEILALEVQDAEGLLRIRGIGFLQLLDMPDEEVTSILQNYGDSVEEIEHVISGLAKIRSNIDLIESDLAFDDDTRNLIKLVVRLNKEHIEDPDTILNDSPLENVSSQDFDQDGISQPLRMSTDPPSTPIQTSFNEKNFSTTPESSQKVQRSSPLCLSNLPRQHSQHPASPGIPTLSTSGPTSTCTTAPTSSQTDSLTPNGFTTDTGFPKSANYFWNGDVPVGGISVPATPLWTERGACAVAVSPPHGVQSTWNGFIAENSLFSSGDRNTCQNPPNYYIRDRERSRQPGTPPPKHRLKLLFPLHRSKSHESNLSNRVTPPTTCNASVLQHEVSRPLVGSSTLSPDALSANGEAFVYQDATTGSPLTTCFRIANNAQLSPTPNIRGCVHEHYPCGAFDAQPTTRVVLSSPNSHSYDSVRRISCDYRSPKRPLQPPTLMTTSVDGENLVGMFHSFSVPIG